MKKKIKIISICLACAIGVSIACLVPCLVINNKNNSNNMVDNQGPNNNGDNNGNNNGDNNVDGNNPPIENNILNYVPVNNNDIIEMSDFRYEDIGVEKRNIQTQYYDSPCWTKYHDKYNFIYPGYNRNYEHGNNRWFGTSDDPKIINGSHEVFNERVPNTNYCYNNSDWIVSEIKNGNFKKHHAADNFIETNLNNIQDSVIRKFTIGTNTFGPLGLGLYAPPGEVITIKFDDATWHEMERTNFRSIQFVINNNFWDNKDENDSSQISNRYPFLCSFFNNIDHEFKIGSPFGGAISIFVNDTLLAENSKPTYRNSLPITFSVSGAIPCMLYVDGKTSESDFYSSFNKLKNGEIAPVIQGNSAYFHFNLPFVSFKFINDNIDWIKYPTYNFRKIVQFFSLEIIMVVVNI